MPQSATEHKGYWRRETEDPLCTMQDAQPHKVRSVPPAVYTVDQHE